MRCLLRSVKGRFAHAALAASITAGVSKYRPSLGIALVDALLENIRLGLESPETGAALVVHQRKWGERGCDKIYSGIESSR